MNYTYLFVMVHCRDACRERLPAVVGKTFPEFPAHAHPQFYVSGKRPMVVAMVLTVVVMPVMIMIIVVFVVVF